jgi:hypothetical protein
MHTVETHTIGAKARAVIDAYLSLSLSARPSCPYFNNRRKKTRGNLRVLIGKGTPEEIVEEAHILAKLGRISINELSPEKTKEFLVTHNLGIDCSGFAYHVLNAFAQEKTGKSITSFVTSTRTGIIGTFLARLRPAENLGVNSFRHGKNSSEISISTARAGDIITFIGTGKEKTYNHILVITGVSEDVHGVKISYAHSYAWPSDGLYNHGVREGSITLHDDNVMNGTWHEQGVTGNDNYTLESAKAAQEVSVRRLAFNI